MTANTRKTAAKKTTPKKPTSPAQWKKGQAEPVELPSGNYMRVRRIGMETIMATGKMPNSLMNIVRKAVDKGTGMQDVDMDEIMDDPKGLEDMMKFMDDLAILVSVEPKVHKAPADEAEREDDVLYSDEVDMEDKSFLFQLSMGGTTDLESFRQGLDANLATVPRLQDVELPSK